MIREKLYRDPIHDLIALDKNSREDRTIIALIDAQEMQRLRRIRQLGLASLAFQGAEHSRFTHSLGVMWLATRILGQLSKQRKLNTRQIFLTRCAALLHDVGHGPLSHVVEKFLGVHHETWTARILLSPHSEVNRILRQYHPSSPRDIVNIIEGRATPPFLSQIITSQFDADRFDYLLRDSAMTGVKYGIYDLERILHILRLDARGQNIVVARNGIQPVEKYLQSRYHMYSQVYLHKTVRAAEMMFRLLLKRGRDLAVKGQLPVLDSTEPMARLLLNGSAVEMGDYLDVDDDIVFSSLKRWRKCKDPILADLSRRILERRVLKTLDVSKVRNLPHRIRRAKEYLRSNGMDPDYYFAVDTSGDTPYRPYDPRNPKGSEHILVETLDRKRPYRDIHEMSEVVVGLTRAAFTIRRAMFPEFAGKRNLRLEMENILLG
ncbi:MAG: HD domain-containing protein [Candidatus Sumerlaeaceae bacterium]|nr:HD domain-containing protein [Candidatus Sumerlaeaceae bacterium]